MTKTSKIKEAISEALMKAHREEISRRIKEGIARKKRSNETNNN